MPEDHPIIANTEHPGHGVVTREELEAQHWGANDDLRRRLLDGRFHASAAPPRKLVGSDREET